MSFASLLIHFCGIEADVGVTPDGYGNIIEDWQDIAGLEDFPCRLQAGTGTEVLVGAEVVVADYILFLDEETPLGIPVLVTEQNRVHVWRKDSSGAWILKTYEILLVRDIQDGINGHHKECHLRTVR